MQLLTFQDSFPITHKYHRMKNFVLLIVFISLSVTCCKKEKDFVESLPSCPVSIVFPVSPIDLEHVIRIIPLGHYNPSRHVFPASHHYIDIVRGISSIPVYAPCDGWITFITENQLPSPISFSLLKILFLYN